MILGARASIQGCLASSCNSPAVESWEQVMAAAVRSMIVHPCALGSAARTHCRASFDESPDLCLLLCKSFVKLFGDKTLHFCLAEHTSNLQCHLLCEASWVPDVEVCNHREALREQDPCLAALLLIVRARLSGKVSHQGLEARKLRSLGALSSTPSLGRSHEGIKEGPQLRSDLRSLDARYGYLPVLKETGENLMEVSIDI
mmetsp:Transcript_31463/g.57124  ORF Transcript_31463/g.57124 Transcript_31463/m.57124 type:complete len:201 (+) Transcript_31463:384-986(+)